MLFRFIDIGMSVVPLQSGSDPVGQIKGFPTMLQKKKAEAKFKTLIHIGEGDIAINQERLT